MSSYSLTGSGRVYLVGAGCGEADLITLRGLNLLQTADAVIYDDLIAPDLLSAAPSDAEKIYVGKRSGKHSMLQNEINNILIQKAQQYNTVVRLKGGDPFVFGRGGEEMAALQDAGIWCREVPGISSAIAIPAVAGIPVTHRGISRNLHIVSAHTADTPDGLPENLDVLAKAGGTIVFLMGLSLLGKISEKLIAFGMSPDTPAAVISGGNSANPATVRGQLGNIKTLVDNVGIVSPAVIVIGGVADLKLGEYSSLPLDGISVGITGTDSIQDKLRRGLSELGASVTSIERSIVKSINPEFDFDILAYSNSPWIVFTSGNGVKRFFELLSERRYDIRRLHSCKYAVIGAATSKELGKYGIIADICPLEYNSHALAENLSKAIPKGTPVFLFRSAQGNKYLYDYLQGSYKITDIHTYDVKADPEITLNASSRLSTLDYITFSSAGGVRLFIEQFGSIPRNVKCVCIGHDTADVLLASGHSPIISEHTSAEGIIQAVVSDSRIGVE